MKIGPILGKVLALTKEYHYSAQTDGFVRHFFTGPRRLPLFGVGLSWWLTRRGVVLLDDLARMIISRDSSSSFDASTVRRTIEEVLQINAVNKELFVADPFIHHETLFDARYGAPAEFASAIWVLIEEALQRSIAEWLIVAPLNHVIADTTSLSECGLWLITPGDEEAWRMVAADFVNARQWNTRTGLADPRDEGLMSPIPVETWLACRAWGTSQSAIRIARERIRTFIALVFALAPFDASQLLLKSAAQPPPSTTTQFPATGTRTGVGYCYSDVGEVLPSLAVAIEVKSQMASDIRQWYIRILAGSEEKRKRAIIASHFVHSAFVADDIDRFIHFFIALDALFGIRGNVETMIVKGVERTFGGDPTWISRAERLFQLRNELIHGGTSSIEQWVGYSSYERHFQTEPIRDIAVMALLALRSFA